MTKLKLKKKALISIIFFVLGIFLIGISILFIYLSSPVDKNSTATIVVDIKSGTSTNMIAEELKNRDLIRSPLVFKLIAKFHTKKTLKATVYELKKSMSTEEIAKTLTEGNNYNPDLVKITFKEGQSLKKYALQIAENTNNTYEDVITKVEDNAYLDSLISKYWFLTDEIKNNDIYVSLEGYLSPNTYEFVNKDVSVEEIFKVMLDQTEKELNPYKDTITNSKWTVHEYMTLASMLELEGTNTKNRKMIAGVFINRLNKGMNLGSDVTTYYAFQEEMKKDLTAKQFSTSNPYNTRASDMGGKLPVGPICNPSNDSIEASINPTTNDYLFFVADKHGKIYYTKTEKEHTAKVAEIKEKGDWIW